MEDHWRGLRGASLHEQQYAAAERAGIIPSEAEMLRRVRAAAEAAGELEELESGGLVVQLPPVPPPTPEMERLADERVAEERREWDAAVSHFRDQP
jgi:hypothetical protein